MLGRWGRGNWHQPRPCPQMWHETVTLFHELKTSAYRCKKERSCDAKMRFRPDSAPDPTGVAHDAAPDSLVGGGGHTSPHTQLHSASILLPSALAIWRHLTSRGYAPNYISLEAHLDIGFLQPCCWKFSHKELGKKREVTKIRVVALCW